MRAYFKSYWFWFYVVVALVSVLDFIDHITRDEPNFREIWIRWILFTILSTGAVCLCVHYLNMLFRKIFNAENIVLQSITIVLAFMVHQYITGPAFDLLLFGRVTLNFVFNGVSLMILLLIFYTIRVIIFLITRKSSSSQTH